MAIEMGENSYIKVYVYKGLRIFTTALLLILVKFKKLFVNIHEHRNVNATCSAESNAHLITIEHVAEQAPDLTSNLQI